MIKRTPKKNQYVNNQQRLGITKDLKSVSMELPIQQQMNHKDSLNLSDLEGSNGKRCK